MSRGRFGHIGPLAHRRTRPEDAEQLGIRQLVASLGGRCWVLGTRRKRGDHPGTMQSFGLPDLWIVLPARDPQPGVSLWWEVKAPGGQRSPAQIEFGDWCDAGGTAYGHGTLDTFIAWLIARGRLRADQVAHYRVPKGA